MFRPTRAVFEAAASASQPLAPSLRAPKRVFAQDLLSSHSNRPNRSDRDSRPQSRDPLRPRQHSSQPGGQRQHDDGRPIITDLLLRGAPKFALAADVLRALRDRKLVDENFPLANITPFPIGCKRDPRFGNDIHITLPDNTTARKIVAYSQKSSLFPNSTSTKWRVDFCRLNASQWKSQVLHRFNSRTVEEERRSNRYLSPDIINAEGLSGRRVVLKGLPVNISDVIARQWILKEVLGWEGDFSEWRQREEKGIAAPNVGLLDKWHGVKRIPRSKGANTSKFILTFDSVVSATRAARKLNMSQHIPPTTDESHPPEPFLVKAEVYW